MLGTLDYVAPERIQGGETGPWTDVYALGCVLFFALTGAVVFPLEEPERKLWAHLSAPPPPTGVTPERRRGRGRGRLAKDPRERYESAPDLAASLQRAVGEAPAVRVVDEIAEIERRLNEVRRQQIPGKVQLVEQLAQQLADLRRAGGA